MADQIRELNDDSVAQVAIDHPCIHDWCSYFSLDFHYCRTCDFHMRNSEFKKYMEKQNGRV